MPQWVREGRANPSAPPTNNRPSGYQTNSGYSSLPSQEGAVRGAAPPAAPAQAPAAAAMGTPADSTPVQGVAVGGVPGAGNYGNDQGAGTTYYGAQQGNAHLPQQGNARPAQGYPPQGYPPQQGNYGPPQGAYGATETTYMVMEGPNGSFTEQQVYIHETKLGDQPCEVYCTNCHRVTMTEVEEYAGWLPWSIFAVSCICFMLPLCCVFCGPCLMDKVHICRRCKNVVGRRPACS